MVEMDEFQRMENLKEWFLSTSDVHPTDVALGEDEWSLAQVVDHLVIVEKGLLVALSRAKERMPAETPNLSKLKDILESGQRYEVPVPSAIPANAPDLGLVLETWTKVRQKLKARIEAGDLPGADVMVYEHPVGGPMNASQTLEFLTGHLVYHKTRVESLLPKKPASAR